MFETRHFEKFEIRILNDPGVKSPVSFVYNEQTISKLHDTRGMWNIVSFPIQCHTPWLHARREVFRLPNEVYLFYRVCFVFNTYIHFLHRTLIVLKMSEIQQEAVWHSDINFYTRGHSRERDSARLTNREKKRMSSFGLSKRNTISRSCADAPHKFIELYLIIWVPPRPETRFRK